MKAKRPWYEKSGFIDPFKFREHQLHGPPVDTWDGLMMQLSSDEICQLDRMLFEAKGG